jgi:phosphotransferase system enzyme I (PtsI)
MHNTIKAAQQEKIDISVCGELAGSLEGAMLLVGLGVRSLSVSPRKINKVKEVLSRFTLQEIETVTKESFNYSDANTVFSTINSFIK